MMFYVGSNSNTIWTIAENILIFYAHAHVNLALKVSYQGRRTKSFKYSTEHLILFEHLHNTQMPIYQDFLYPFQCVPPFLNSTTMSYKRDYLFFKDKRDFIESIHTGKFD
jgi:hypothetical protein